MKEYKIVYFLEVEVVQMCNIERSKQSEFSKEFDKYA